MSLIAAIAAAAALAVSGGPCERELIVLGAGQDAGAPQIGNSYDEGQPLLPSSLALVDRKHGTRYLFDATPTITRQLKLLDRQTGRGEGKGLGIDGIFLTHAHIGHYLGLAFLGVEAANADKVPVYAMPRMAAFLRENGPWNQLVEKGNIGLREMTDGDLTVLSDDFGVLPIRVPHRDEYSETVGFLIMTPDRRAIYMPDLDSWDELAEMGDNTLESLIAGGDFLFLDATFYDDNELPGRDMSRIPHPRVKATMERLKDLPLAARRKVHLIHYNHTNPIRDHHSAATRDVRYHGFNIARMGQSVCLSR